MAADLAELPEVIEWLDTAAGLMTEERRLPSTVAIEAGDRVFRFVEECGPDLELIGRPRIDAALWRSNPTLAVQEARHAMHALLLACAVRFFDMSDEEISSVSDLLGAAVVAARDPSRLTNFDLVDALSEIHRAMAQFRAFSWLAGIEPPAVRIEDGVLPFLEAHHRFLTTWLAPRDGAVH